MKKIIFVIAILGFIFLTSENVDAIYCGGCSNEAPCHQAECDNCVEPTDCWPGAIDDSCQTCPAGKTCSGGSCVPVSTGACNNNSDCDDYNPCTQNICVGGGTPAAYCDYGTDVPNGTPCTSGGVPGTCQNGICTGATISCLSKGGQCCSGTCDTLVAGANLTECPTQCCIPTKCTGATISCLSKDGICCSGTCSTLVAGANLTECPTQCCIPTNCVTGTTCLSKDGICCSGTCSTLVTGANLTECPTKCCTAANCATGGITPSAPTLLPPPYNGATGVSLQPTLDWSDTIASGGWYIIYYKKSSETSWSFIGSLALSQYSFSLALTLAGNTTYQWKVVACNPGALCSPDSETRSFTTASAGCSDRGEACTANSQCCSNKCSTFSGACYGNPPGVAGTRCYDPAECLSNSCLAPAIPGNPGNCMGGCAAPNSDPHKECVGGKCQSVAGCGKDDCTACGGAGGGIKISLSNPLRFSTFKQLVDNLINFIFTLGVILAPLMYLVAGIYIVTAAGDSQKVTTGKNIILYTTIGLGIILLARGLIAVIQSAIGG